MFCRKCGSELKEGEVFCGTCGTKVGDVGIEKTAEEKYPHLLATVLGYIFGILGGWLGLIFGIYLLKKDHPRAKFHGKIILVITIVMIVFGILSIVLSL